MSILFYPDGRPVLSKKEKTEKDRRKTENRTAEEKEKDKLVRTNMGMDFESDIEKSCDFYRAKGLADFYKRPTPIKVVHMSRTHPGQIDEAYFQEKSTTDFVGIYKGKYIDFEAKETIHDSVPYHMIREQQFTHLAFILKLGGIGFFLVRFKTAGKAYLLPASILLDSIKDGSHPGFKRSFFAEKGILVNPGYMPPYYLLDAIDEAFFKN